MQQDRGVYSGLWKRASIAFEGGAPQESATVYWLQGLRYFADLRIPHDWPPVAPGRFPVALSLAEMRCFARCSAFGGTIETSPGHIRWTHHLDFLPRPGAVDEGTVFWQDGALIEDGSFVDAGRRVHYREVWVPQPLGSGDLQVFTLVEALAAESGEALSARGILVIVGEHFIHLRDERGYASDFAAPDPAQMDAAALRHFLRFTADYGHRNPGNGDLTVTLSSNPDRPGKRLWADIQQEETTWWERTVNWAGQSSLYRWQRVECSQLE